MAIGAWNRGRPIGRGSSATVSLASSSPSGDVFAVKSAELSRSGLLQREQRILSALNCPHIVSYLGFDVKTETSDHRLYYNLFMEYAPGGSISDEIKKQGTHLDEPTVRSHTYGILSGLAYLHSKRISHCDIKGQNVLIGSDGQAKIADLGCARWVDGDDGSRPIGGTPMFMAPEVARGEEQGPAGDVWALGCTVIEMATGRAPWADVSDPVSVLHRIAFSVDVPEFPRWVSDEGKDFLSKCLRRDPKERWTVDQLLKHPFVANCSQNSKLSKDSNSPKSTLDQEFWESSAEEEEEEEEEGEVEESSDDPAERIQCLIGGGSSSTMPNWTWDENWITVRNNGGEFTFFSTPEEEEDQIPVDEWAGDLTSSSSSSSSSNGEEFMGFNMGTEELISSPCNFYHFVSYSDNNTSAVVGVEEKRDGEEEKHQFSSCTKDANCEDTCDCSINQKPRHSICAFQLDPFLCPLFPCHCNLSFTYRWIFQRWI